MNRKLRALPHPDSAYVDPRDKFTLRLPPDLKAWLEGEARAHDRTLNAEIVHRLRRERDSYRQ